MTNVVRPSRRRAQAVLNHLLALGIEARRRFVENQHARIGENRARDRDALPLPARQLDAALADDRVVAVREPEDELLAVRDARRRLDLVERRRRIGVADVLGDRAVEEKVLLQHRRELLAIVAQRNRRQVAAVDEDAARAAAG